jgi:formate dehydrogenase subunit delta
MHVDDLVRMANQIAQFFAPYPEEDAVEGVREHLNKFWDPAMRKELLGIANGLTPSPTPLNPLVLKAAAGMRPTEHE